MPSPQRTLSRDEARDLVAARCFERVPDVPGGAVGVELERLAVCVDDPSQHPPIATVRRAAEAAGPLPRGSRVSFEPGGQVELASPPLPLLEACDALACDSELLGQSLEGEGVALVGLGLEPGPLHERVVHSPRYDAMEKYFDEGGAAGRTMMRGTAAIQVNLAFADPADVERQWRVAHDLGPMLAAAFANSPFGDDGPTGWRSSRLAIWWEIDPGRTRPAAGEVGTACRPAFTDYALAARVMSVRTSDTDQEPLLAPLTFTDWLDDGHELGWPTADDLEYHLTTLFPPVRPRGWLELRMIDALPNPWWRVASAVTAVLVQDPALAEPVARVVDRARGLWIEAARDGLSHPDLGASAIECFTAALDHLPTVGADAETIGATEEYIDRYVSRGECPADYLLGEWHTRGRTMPLPDNCANEWS